MNHQAILANARDTVQRADHKMKTATDIGSRAKAAGLKAEAEVLLEAAELAASEAEQLEWAGAFPCTDLAGRPAANPFQK